MKKLGKLSSIRQLAKDTSGAALVEMSLLILPLMGLMIGAVEYGRVFQQYHVASKGVTAASRYLARVEIADICGTPGGDWTAAIATAKGLAQKGKFDAGASAILTNWDDPNDITIPTPDCANNVADGMGITPYRGPAGNGTLARVTVSTSFTYEPSALFAFINDGVQITASHTELYIGG